jgi:hypothetical protein
MKTDAFETGLRQALGRRAAQVPGEAIQRLERRDYWPPSRTRRAVAAAGLVSAAAAGAAAGPRRRTMLAGGAAAVILLGGAGYGLTAAFAGHPASLGGTRTAALTAVHGCAALAQVTGTLEQVNGTALVIQTPGGQPVTVTTTAATRVSLSAAPLSDITDGAYVRVDGVKSGGTIAAGKVAVGESPSGKSQPPGGQHTAQTLPGGTIVQGTAADATSAGFTVDTPAGTQVPVTTSSSTLVVVNSAGPGDLQTGANTIAVGYAGPDGTLPAIAIAQFPSTAPIRLAVSGCSPSAIDTAITTALLAGG